MKQINVRKESLQPQPQPQKKKGRAITIRLSLRVAIVCGIILLLLASFVSGTIYGEHRQKQAKYTNPRSHNASNVSSNRWASVGTILEVSDSEIKVKDSRNQEKVAKITKDTKIVDRKGTNLTTKELKKDQRVIVSGEKDGNKLTATRIRLQQ